MVYLLKMVDLSMAMLNNQRVHITYYILHITYYIYIYTTARVVANFDRGAGHRAQ